MKSIFTILVLGLLLAEPNSSIAVEGFKDYKFGLTFEEAQKINPCKWSKQDTNFRGFMIIGNKNADLYKCNDFEYEGQRIEFYLEFVENTLQRIILDISGDEESNQKKLGAFKKQYGFDHGELINKGRSKQFTFDDNSVEVELYDPPLNLMYLRFYSGSYRQLIKKPYLNGLTT